MLNWFDAKVAKEFGDTLAVFLIETMPKEAPTEKNKVLAKRSEVIASLLWKVDAFKSENKLNFYKKAQLANVLKWRLKEANFDDVFIDEITHLVVTSV